MTYYAHSDASHDPASWHRLSAHLEGVGERAAGFLKTVGFAEFGRAAGLLHDLGKYTPEFQRRLSGSSARVDHSTAGAHAVTERYGKTIGKLLAYCIAGHHAGLANGVNGERTTAIEDRLRATIPKLDPVWTQEVSPPELPQIPQVRPRDRETAGFCAAFFTRMVFSALVDADYLDTEAWYAGRDGTPKPRGRYPSAKDLLERLTDHLDSVSTKADPSEINRLRREVLDHVRRQAAERPGLFSLTVPTGGGKTLTSLAFALEHAVLHGHARVIYVIPYMSIVEQTAQVFRNALRSAEGDDADFVIEHHSTFDVERIGQREAKDKLRLAMENWDAPIIVTTSVQFFESLFSNRPSRCRKLHNIANSMVILDEAQTMPLKFLRPCVAALDELARNWRASVVLCTATQPAVRADDGFFSGLEDVRELAPEPRRLYTELKRTRIEHRGQLDDSQLAERLSSSEQALCIVNTRRHARELYESLGDAEGAVHLTTLMCARHRRERLEAVRESLRVGSSVRLIATSLVEAGVDLDFPVVWRAEAGLESIIQAAGRCNREGRAPMSSVFVFTPADGPGRKPPPEIAQFADAARYVMRRYADDPMSLDAVREYFQELYWSKGAEELDAKRILRDCQERRSSLDFPFETIADKFRVIENTMAPLIVPWRGENGDEDTAECLIGDLKWVERPGGIARRLQPFVVQVRRDIRNMLLSCGAAKQVREDFADQFVVLDNMDLYRPNVGLVWEDPTFRTAEGLML